MKFGARAEAWVSEPGCLEPLDGSSVEIDALVLVDRVSVPLESEPAQVVEQELRPRAGLGARIEVFDAQRHAPALVSRREPCHE